jgi:two-component system sensor kinase FixL
MKITFGPMTPAGEAGWVRLRCRQLWPAAAVAFGYLTLYLILDQLSFIDALHGIGITPWSPSAGLTLALLIRKGALWSPIVFVGELLSGAALPAVAAPPLAIFGAAFLVSAGYAGAAATLRRLGLEPSLGRSKDVVLLFIVTIIGSGLVACGFVSIYCAAGIVPWSGLADAAFQFWIGDAIGIAVLAPPLLSLDRLVPCVRPAGRRLAWPQRAELAAQGASVVAAIAAVFSEIGGDHPFELFYLLFLPLIWVATRYGVAGASWAVLAIQIGLVVGLQLQNLSQPTLRAFQLLMFALATTGLMLGAVVSERHRLSHALAESESRRRTILNTTRDGVLTIDGDGKIQSINPAVERLFSRPGHLLIGQNVREFIDAAPDMLQKLKRITCLPDGEATSQELYARRADGGVFPIELTIGRFDPSDLEQYTLAIRDITLRHEAEARAREHQSELARVSRISLAGEMAAALAHELSQPLTAIAAYGRGCLRLLARSAPEPKLVREGMLEVVQQAERAGDVLSRLREFVRSGACQRALINVTPLVDTALSLARIEATQNEVEIASRIDPSLPAVLADHIQIEQVLLNLLRNAVDAIVSANSEQRLVVVEAYRKSSRAVEISVADSGPGIAEELVGRIFEPFVTTKALGMGMGLSISRSIIKAHGGSLRVARGVKSGATFAFDLPIDGPAETRYAG